MKIKIGIVGYGNVGKGVEKEIKKNKEFELVGIFTRRNIEELDTLSKVYNLNDIKNFVGKIDVMILCQGSANDLPRYTHVIAKNFNTVDSFDTHAKIYEYFKHINKINKKSNTVSIVSVGWDPGLFSYSRLIFDCILPTGKTHTFWGSGVSQGHSEAVRSLKGVKYAVAYTHPKREAVDKVRKGEDVKLKVKDKHTRECYVVLEEDTPDIRKDIDKRIKTMPNYFAEYDTTINYIKEEEFKTKHTKMPHGGFTLAVGTTGESNKQIAELSLKLDSNPEFTASVLIAYARAAYKLAKDQNYGAYTIFDIPLTYISNKKTNDLIKKLL